MANICPICGAQAVLSRVKIHRAPWYNSPALWISGAFADLQTLIKAGYVTRLPSGWHIPTTNFPGV